jgi:hypothetical protein
MALFMNPQLVSKTAGGSWSKALPGALFFNPLPSRTAGRNGSVIRHIAKYEAL